MGLLNIFNRKKAIREKGLKLLLEMQEDATKYFEKIGPVILGRQQPDRSDFGLCESNPICTTSLLATEAYLKRLCTKDGHKFTWPRYHSIRTQLHGLEDVGEDVYTLYLDGEVYTKIYVVPYIGMSKFPPAGLIFCDDDKDWDLEREAFGRGLDVEDLIKMHEIEKHNKELGEKIKEENEKRDMQRKKELALNAETVKVTYPSFDLDKEMQNTMFSTLVAMECDLLLAYEYIHKTEYFDKLEAMPPKSNSESFSIAYYYDLICELEKCKKPEVRELQEDDLIKEANERQIEVKDIIKLHHFKNEHDEFLWNMQLKHFQELAKQAMETKRLFPLFDLQADWRNDMFQKLITHFDMHIAHEILHFSYYYVRREIKPISIGPIPNNIAKEQLFCRKCGESLASDSSFCHRCGTKVINP